LLASCLLGAAMGVAWLLPGTPWAALLWAGATPFLVHFNIAPVSHPVRATFVAGVVGCTIAFHWLMQTIADFSGLPLVVAALAYAVFVAITAAQFALFAVLARLIDSATARFALTTPLAWIAAETLSPRIFPWEPAHTQVTLLPLVQVSDLAGSQLVGFLLFWLAEGALRAWRARRPAPCVAPLVVVVAAGIYGEVRLRHFDEIQGAPQPVALVQANVSIGERERVKEVGIRTDRYVVMSREIHDPNALIVWPETALQAWLPVDLASRKADRRIDELFPPAAQMLIGTLTTDGRRRYNSALAIRADGSVAPPYHKRILMPFGEYMPLQSVFPQIAKFNASFSPMDAGESVAVVEYSKALRAAPLICYEDIEPSLARESVLAGATLLVNLTNDVWFGNSVAPRQHHLIASFRAIENRRWLLRSTNTGLTAIVSPAGRTVAQLPGFSDGILRSQAGLLEERSFYTAVMGEKLWWVLTLLACALAAHSWWTTTRWRRKPG
jgi:apolipoprotein N-acyltransferase